MGKIGIAVVAIVSLLILIGGGLAISRHHNSSAPANTNPVDTSASGASNPLPASSDQATSSSTITYTDNGFSPATLSVKSGTQITIKNDSSHILQFDSDPHPEHTDDIELNVGVIPPGGNQTILVTKTGTHGYHNHANADDTGTIIVQ